MSPAATVCWIWSECQHSCISEPLSVTLWSCVSPGQQQLQLRQLHSLWQLLCLWLRLQRKRWQCSQPPQQWWQPRPRPLQPMQLRLQLLKQQLLHAVCHFMVDAT